MRDNKTINNFGILIISLDFELLWGVIDNPDVKIYAESNVKHVPEVIDRMLQLFEKYNIKATFSTVGLLMCKDKDDATKYVPEKKPTYKNNNLSPYGQYLEGIKTSDHHLYFAPSIIDKLKSFKNIEIGSHTFCHYYCWENGQTIEQFEDDIKAAVNIAKATGIDVKSIVFPRNNVNEDYLKICKKYGIVSYRGNALRYFNKSKGKLDALFNRLCRLVDTYIPISGMNTYALDELKVSSDLPLNLPASRFFRPYSKRWSLLEPLKILRIKSEIKFAAKHGEVYHLWWHPHNFGANINHNLKELETVLRCYQNCRRQYGMQSFSMKGLTDYFKI